MWLMVLVLFQGMIRVADGDGRVSEYDACG